MVSVGAMGDESGMLTSSSMALSYSHFSSVSGIAGRAVGGGMNVVGVVGGGFRRVEQHGKEPAAALFAESQGWM